MPVSHRTIAEALARRVVEAYAKDVLTGNAPGISLQDLITSEVEELLRTRRVVERSLLRAKWRKP